MSKKKTKRPPQAGRNTSATAKTDRASALAGLAVAFITFVVFSRVLFNDFVNYDDDLYVTGNPVVLKGLSLDGLLYIVTDTSTGNWHPLTMLSHTIDATLFDLDPMGHHLTSLVLHTANTWLLFFVLYRMTGAIWPSAAVALSFGIHPLHVASVAHISQRKDVLSALFLMLTLLLYYHYTRTLRARDLAATVAAFGLGLAAKSMMVTLPIVLLLLDVWPLRRLTPGSDGLLASHRQWMTLVREKIPFVILSLAVGIVTFFAQRATGATEALAGQSLVLRLQNVVVSYAVYLLKTFWPTNLAAFYPFPEVIPAWTLMGAMLTLCMITALAIVYFGRTPYVLTGWLWYLITLAPVIGFIQVGAQARADRYTYIPLIGVFVAMVWGARDVIRGRPRWRAPVLAVSCAVMAGFAAVSWVQIGSWRNSQTLWEHTIAATGDNYVAQCGLGMVYVDAGDLVAAERHFLESLRIERHFGLAKHNLANIYAIRGVQHRDAGRHGDAILSFAKALELEPGDYDILVEMGHTHADARDIPKAIEFYGEALRQRPGSAEAHLGLGIAYEESGDSDSAQREFEATLQIEPDSERARSALERLRTRAEANDEAGILAESVSAGVEGAQE